jgi:hypothetical protein
MLITAITVALTINVISASDISSTVVSRALDETDSIWRAAGVEFVWKRNPASSSTPAALTVVIGHDLRPVREGALALGWIYFDESTPGQRLYISYANVQQLMRESMGVLGPPDHMPIFEREVLMARAIGRALAHELGHYFLASKEHTKNGLMKAHRSAVEFFGPDHRPFKLDGAQRSQITARLAQEAIVVRR